ncbi:MAG: hypothetical protein CBE00_14070 [Planctomycetaceae bacterium TMED240]|nr:hypothetical protein [Rhodopirellula sp.]OUX03546.1 MAG: hypothetical protein CBE00_14070 [Planctomycetaceae bacterium TMED240]
MRISLKFLIVTLLLPALSLSAQQSEIVDPTTESPEIKAQLDTIRGVEQMESLRKQFNELMSQNQQLMQKLSLATDKIDAMQSEMDALRQGQEQAARRRSVLPELRLVAQIKTASVKQADVSVGGRTYRVSDGRPFRLQLSDQDVLLASPAFQEDGAIRLKIDDLSMEDLEADHVLSFKPTPPDPAKASPAKSEDND